MKDRLKKILDERVVFDYTISDYKSTELLKVYMKGTISFEPHNFLVGSFEYECFEKGKEGYLEECINEMLCHIKCNPHILKPKIIKETK